MSKERGNLLNLNSPKYSGISNAVTVHVHKTKTGVEVTRRRRRNINRPKTSLFRSVQKNANRKQKIGNAVAGLANVRSSLKTAAARRWERVYRINRRNQRRIALREKTKKGEKKSNETKNVNDVN